MHRLIVVHGLHGTFEAYLRPRLMEFAPSSSLRSLITPFQFFFFYVRVLWTGGEHGLFLGLVKNTSKIHVDLMAASSKVPGGKGSLKI